MIGNIRDQIKVFICISLQFICGYVKWLGFGFWWDFFELQGGIVGQGQPLWALEDQSSTRGSQHPLPSVLLSHLLPAPATPRKAFPLWLWLPHTPLHSDSGIPCPHWAWPEHPHCRRHPQRFSSVWDFLFLHLHTKSLKTNQPGIKLAPALQNA